MRFLFEIYPDKKGEWRWRLRSMKNKKVLADSGEGYKRKRDCERAILRISDLREAMKRETLH